MPLQEAVERAEKCRVVDAASKKSEEARSEAEESEREEYLSTTSVATEPSTCACLVAQETPDRMDVEPQ